ncbi:DNA-binding Lrp family transcriptional regulator [Streptacidiphilus sp. MAP12-20]|uniref:Lrp/AsnC family transcriptional regulator n=1 Tax=Streptacidiphilus sp. MAP12-20 TaxID=3156299 RepID=UPI003518A004
MTERTRRWVDEDDVALLDALHVNPRASFERLGAALGVSPVTAARRWRRLAEAGQAWISSVPGPQLPMSGALFEATCVPGQVQATAAALTALPQVFSVHLTTGTNDLYALVVAADAQILARLLLEDLPQVPGLLRVRSSVITQMFSGAHWRLGAISRQQASEIQSGDEDPRSDTLPPPPGLNDFEQALFLALQDDGRAGYRDLAAALGRSEQSVKRRLGMLVRRGQLDFRTDFVRPEGGWRAQVALWLRVPDEQVDEVGTQLSGWPQIRVCAALVGRANLFTTLQLHSLHELSGVLCRVRGAWPAVHVSDRRVVLRSTKSWGRVLDADGYAVGVVPVNPWAPPASAP